MNFAFVEETRIGALPSLERRMVSTPPRAVAAAVVEVEHARDHDHGEVFLEDAVTNVGRKHATVKTTPAVAAGIVDTAHTMLDLAHLIECEEEKPDGRLTDYLRAV